MTELVAQLLRAFVAPDPAPRAAARPADPFVVVLAAPRLAAPASAAVALALGRGAALACVWTGADPPLRGGFPAAPAARRLAVRLREHGLAARATGRLALVDLPADPQEAALEATAAAEAGRGAPAVVALGGPRTPEFDPLIARCDAALVVVAPDSPSGLADLAVTRLAAQGCGARVLELELTAGQRLAAGFGPTPRVGAVVRPVVA